MIGWLRRSACVAAIVATHAVLAEPVVRASVLAAEDSLSEARNLYAAAAYEDALAVLDRLRASRHDTDDRRAIEQYRAFCLLALGR